MKKVILFGIVFLLLISLVSARSTNPDDYVIWDMAENTTTGMNMNIWVAGGVNPVQNTTIFQEGSSSGTVTQYIRKQAVGVTDYIADFWAYKASGTDRCSFGGLYGDWWLVWGAGGGLASNGDNTFSCRGDMTLTEETWHNIVFNSTNGTTTAHIFIDNILYCNITTGGGNDPTDFDYFLIGDEGAAPYGACNIDNFTYARRSVFEEGGGGSPATIGSINVTIQTPIDGSNYGIEQIEGNNSNIQIGGIHNESSWATCTVNDTSWSSGTNITYNFTFNNNTALSSGPYSIEVFCGNSTVNGTDTVSFYVDKAYPAIEDNYVNGTVFFNRNLTIDFNFTDDYSLWSYNITVDDVMINNKSGISSSTYAYNLSYNTSSLVAGIHTLQVIIADGHTAKEIKPYKVDKGLFDSSIKYTKNAQWVKVSSGMLDDWETEKLKDRYTFEYTPFAKSKKHEFEVESNLPIQVIEAPQTEWKKWLIIGDQWMDFHIPGETYTLYISKLTDKKVKVTIESDSFKDKSKFKFNSIGDLNIITKEYTFVTTNSTLTYSSIVNEYETQSIIYYINKIDGITTDAILTYNNSVESFTKTAYSNYDMYNATFITPSINNATLTVPFGIWYNISGETGSINESQTVYQINIDNCSIYGTVAVNMTIKNESSNAEVDGTIAGYFQVWISDSDTYRPFNLSWGVGNKRGICITPSSATYNVYGQLEYAATGFDTKTYYFTNTTLNNITNFVDLYLTPGTTAVTMTVTDENDNPVENAYISILSYDLPTDSYKTTEILKTDSNGVAIANLILNTQWYKFIITYNGEIKLSTSATKVLSTTQSFRITLSEDFFENYNVVDDTACSLSFTNSTRNFAFTFSDSSGNVNQACLKVIQRTINGDTTINTSCLSSSSGSILLNVGSDPTEMYLATGSIYIEGTEYVCAENEINFDNTYKKFGLTGIFVTFLIILTLILVGIWNPIVAVFMMLIGVVLSVISGLFYLSWGVLISFIIVGGIALYKLNRK